MEEVERYDVGVIVGRFQSASLHQAWRGLIDGVRARHDKVIIFIGVSPLWVTRRNPLPFEARKQMIAEAYPDIDVLYIRDVGSDKVWSKRLDRMIGDLIHPGQSAVLYGSRDSFIAQYEGKLSTRELKQTHWVSGSEERKQIARAKARASDDFRAGVIWASHARFPTVYSTVDVVVLRKDPDDEQTYVLVVRKPDEPLWRFIGGFADPCASCDEDDVKREAFEEAGVCLTGVRYIDNTKVDDWRYRSEPDGIRTRLFMAWTTDVRIEPQDDEIAEGRWFRLTGADRLHRRELMPNHRPLFDLFERRIEQDRRDVYPAPNRATYPDPKDQIEGTGS